MHTFGGISNMYTQLMLNMPKEVEYDLALKESNNIHLKESGLKDVPPANRTLDNFICKASFKGKNRLYEMVSTIAPSCTSLGRNRLFSIEKLKEGNFDIFHPTFFDDYFLPYLKGKPYVLTIYDMISEKYLSKDSLQSRNKKEMVKTAGHIIAISEKTKQDIVDILDVDPQKISVVHLAVPDVKPIRVEPILKDNYILFVGNRGGYKNFMPMARFLAPILMKRKDLKIVCTGKPFEVQEINYLQSLGIYDQTLYLRPTDEELRNLYAHAKCFIFPSEYEGFGIPVLEAYQQNCPVLLNNRSCFPEIAQDAAIYFNLDGNESDLTAVMNRFLEMSNEELEQLLIRQRRRLNDFSWKKSAEKLVEIYKTILN